MQHKAMNIFTTKHRVISNDIKDVIFFPRYPIKVGLRYVPIGGKP